MLKTIGDEEYGIKVSFEIDYILLRIVCRKRMYTFNIFRLGGKERKEGHPLANFGFHTRCHCPLFARGSDEQMLGALCYPVRKSRSEQKAAFLNQHLFSLPSFSVSRPNEHVQSHALQ